MERFEDKVKKAFAKRLKAARKNAGYRFANEFAEALKETEHTYRSWERGEYLPDLPKMTRICRLLNVEPNELLPLALKKRDDDEGNGLAGSRAA
jgi:transcriptional regulator with XRE-family HTH domain